MKIKFLMVTLLMVLALIFGYRFTMAADTDSKTSTDNQQTKEVVAGEEINWQVISSGGTNGSSTNYQLMGTIGQTAVNSGSSTNFGINHGYWQNFAGGFVCGDADGSAAVDISDAVYLISYIFGGGPAPVPLAAGDPDCSGAVDISDAVYLISYIFGGGPAPCVGCP